MSFLDILAQKGIIKKADIPALYNELQKSDDGTEKILLEKGISLTDLLNAKSEFFNIPIKRIKPEEITSRILRYIPQESAVYYKFAPINIEDGVLEVGVVEPDNIEARDALQFISAKIGIPIKVFLIPQKDFNLISKQYEDLSTEVTKALTELEKEAEETKGVELLSEKKQKVEGVKITEEAPITKIVAVIIRHATEGNASDVHIEHTGEKVRVRFRVDGVLYTSLMLPPAVHSAVVARIKILSNLKLDERRKPQDGRFSARIDNRKIDFRVSTFPAYYGEKVVMRILDPEKGMKTFEETGLSAERISFLRSTIKRPHGLILITGPTGSGKTTTLYSMLGELDKEQKNIVSLEDPVEYNIGGISQSQVRPEIGYTFANGLRSILRQDPDIIMVGEIRDKETAQLAIQAALTGHLVFSTLHTNSAVGVIPRLIDMGVDPYLIAPTLILTIAQRLIKKLCPESRKPIPIDESTKMMIDKELADLPEKFKKNVLKGDTFYESTPSTKCPSGTKGRVAVFEFLTIDRDMERVILENPVEPEILKLARSKGMITMKEDAIIKAFDGVVSFKEVNTL